LAIGLELMRLKERVYGVLLCTFDEATCIDQGNIRASAIVR